MIRDYKLCQIQTHRNGNIEARKLVSDTITGLPQQMWMPYDQATYYFPHKPNVQTANT
jgi:hypothetical protein